ncbi:hypothetical protein [Endozoicomonas sp. ALC020]|uniref:hypothetical protein n=1 Tax=unclassified Endozoicomonas TaxID=2644528 RepID=UPI003BB0CDDB
MCAQKDLVDTSCRTVSDDLGAFRSIADAGHQHCHREGDGDESIMTLCLIVYPAIWHRIRYGLNAFISEQLFGRKSTWLALRKVL